MGVVAKFLRARSKRLEETSYIKSWVRPCKHTFHVSGDGTLWIQFAPPYISDFHSATDSSLVKQLLYCLNLDVVHDIQEEAHHPTIWGSFVRITR